MAQLIDLGKLRFNFAGEWAIGTTYESNDVVKYNNSVYVYVYSVSTAGHYPTETGYWSLMVPGISFTGTYDAGTTYSIGAAVAYGGKVYVSLSDTNTGHTPPNPTYWSQMADGIQWEGNYSAGTQYQKNDVVQVGSSLYIATQDSLGVAVSNGSYWSKFVDGISAQGVYNAGTQYYTNDLVAYGANIYKATQNSLGNLPTNATYWTLFTSGLRYSSNWATTTNYYPNDIVTYGGQSYICLTFHASGTFATDLSGGKWQKFNSGIRWRGTWTTATAYLTNDVVYDGLASSYIATQDYTSGASVAADVSGGKLTLIAQGSATASVPSMNSSTANKVLGNNGSATVWVSGYSFQQYIDLAMTY